MAYPSRLDNPELLATVAAEYLAGAGLRELACRHKVGWNALRNRLAAAGVEIRPPGAHRTPPEAIQPHTGKESLSAEQVAKLRAAIGYDPSWR